MKQLIALSLLLFIVADLQAQKKQATKTGTTTTATPAVQKTPDVKPAASEAVLVATGSPEAFKKLAGSARLNFDGGKLDDSRFALQQMLAELDMIIGKEVLKVLPQSMMDKPIVTKEDNVSGASGFLGVVIHREYGKEHNGGSDDENRNISVEIISNSPMIASINALLSIPMIGNSGDNKVVKIAGYKALLSKTSGSNNDVNYELQLPMGSSLITVKAPGATQEQVAQLANSLPIQDIAKMLQ
jgi:hypothetical protein